MLEVVIEMIEEHEEGEPPIGGLEGLLNVGSEIIRTHGDGVQNVQDCLKLTGVTEPTHGLLCVALFGESSTHLGVPSEHVVGNHGEHDFVNMGSSHFSCA